VSRRRRLLSYWFVAVALALLPWTGWLSVTLPARHVSRHWDTAWVGFDVGELIMLSLTAWALWRRTAWVEGVAASAGTMLVCDAWFDNLLSAGRHGPDWFSVFLACTSELPLAALCFWVALSAANFYAQLERLRPPRASRDAPRERARV
jgi:hypothetical protein